METWLLTETGRQHIKEAVTKPNKEKPEYRLILILSRGGTNTVEEIARKTGLDKYIVQVNLKKLAEKSWIWKKITKSAEF